MRSTNTGDNDLQKLLSLSIYAQSTRVSVPLSQVANISVEWQASKILRRDRIKTVIIGAQVSANITSADIFSQLIPWLGKEAYPDTHKNLPIKTRIIMLLILRLPV